MVTGRLPEIRSLTSARFFAAASVVVFHFRDPVASLFPAYANLLPLTTAGRMGVDFFFALSGFILTYTYFSWFSQRISKAQYLQFLGYRLARIYPVHLFTLAVLALALGAASVAGVTINHASQYGLDTLAQNLLLVSAWIPYMKESWNIPAWSISAEWFAYLLFPLVALVAARVTSARVAIAAAAAAVLLQILVVPALLGWSQDDFALLRLSGAFTMGCFLGRLYLLGWGARWNWVPVVGFTLAAILIITPFLSTELGGPRRFLVPLFGILVFAIARADGRRGLGWLGSARLVFWGEVSYALYMTHEVVDTLASKVVPMERFAASPLIARIAVVAAWAIVLLVVAALTYLLVERPSRRGLRAAVVRGRQPEASTSRALA